MTHIQILKEVFFFSSAFLLFFHFDGDDFLLLRSMITANWSDAILLLSIRSFAIWPLLNLITQIKMDSVWWQMPSVQWSRFVHMKNATQIWMCCGRFICDQWSYLDECRNILDSICNAYQIELTIIYSAKQWIVFSVNHVLYSIKTLTMFSWFCWLKLNLRQQHP